MHKDRKDHSNWRCRQKYCCQFKSFKDENACICAHKNHFNGRKNCGCTKYITLPDDYRLSIDLSCISFKEIYALRTEIERYNIISRELDKSVCGFVPCKIRKIFLSAHIALLAVTTVAIFSKRPSFKLSLKSSCAVPADIIFHLFALIPGAFWACFSVITCYLLSVTCFFESFLNIAFLAEHFIQ